MKRTRNKYQFKWWHGVLGLVGLSMVLGTVKALAADKADGATRTGTYRNLIIEVYPGSVGGWGWQVIAPFSRDVVGHGQAITAGWAWSEAQAWIDDNLDLTRNPAAGQLQWIHPGQRQTLAAARGGMNLRGGRRALLRTPAHSEINPWQGRWERFTR